MILLIAAACMVLLLISSGCSSGKTKKPQPKRASTLIGYGVTRHWQTIDAKAFADMLYANGLTLTGIEYNPCVKSCSRGGSAADMCFDVGKTAAFVNEMRNRNITTLINVVNWNGCQDVKYSDQWIVDRVNEITSVVGSDNVILSPVSEPWNGDKAKALRWIRLGRQAWSGQFAIAARTGRGNTEPITFNLSFNYVDSHPCSDGEAVNGFAPGVIVNTDCSPVMDPGPERASVLAREAIHRNGNLLIYGWYNITQPNMATINALGAEVQR